MLESIRKEVFERLGKERAKLMKQSRELKLHGFEDLADKTLWEVYGLDTAVEALGFTVVEFHQYYRENRSRFKEEVEQ
jgi:hypothetical protein